MASEHAVSLFPLLVFFPALAAAAKEVEQKKDPGACGMLHVSDIRIEEVL